MRLAVYSDLHLEFEPWQPPRDLAADVVVLAGDIDLGTAGLRWARSAFGSIPVVYVAGNHEFYRADWHGLVDTLRAAAGPVRYLEDDQWIWRGNGESVRFLGATLWTDFAIDGNPQRDMAEATAIMSDYRLIGNGVDGLFPEDVLARHRSSRDWITARLSEPFDGKTVLVTHHAPTRFSLAGSRAGFAPYYASELAGHRPAPDIWIHGHTHTCVDHQLKTCRIIANQRGYGGTHPSYVDGFQDRFVVDI